MPGRPSIAEDETTATGGDRTSNPASRSPRGTVGAGKSPRAFRRARPARQVVPARCRAQRPGRALDDGYSAGAGHCERRKESDHDREPVQRDPSHVDESPPQVRELRPPTCRVMTTPPIVTPSPPTSKKTSSGNRKTCHSAMIGMLHQPHVQPRENRRNLQRSSVRTFRGGSAVVSSRARIRFSTVLSIRERSPRISARPTNFAVRLESPRSGTDARFVTAGSQTPDSGITTAFEPSSRARGQSERAFRQHCRGDSGRSRSGRVSP
ncbi:hypothetical protein ATJ93_3795 [Halopiger aswanensis]|uniref:Uncharacterized protein n=1 Tax=Halopiger aswanensis TaxID=148449 RepID=A0A419W0M8_9EURY|nr:hypothetical protein ATJ93_3795 [Halopiger aswanensis]